MAPTIDMVDQEESIDAYSDLVWQEVKAERRDTDFSDDSQAFEIDFPTTPEGLDRNELAELVRIERVVEFQSIPSGDLVEENFQPSTVQAEYELSVNTGPQDWFLTDQDPYGASEDPSRSFPGVFDWTHLTIMEIVGSATSGVAGGQGPGAQTEPRREWLVGGDSPNKYGPVLDRNDQLKVRLSMVSPNTSTYNFELKVTMRLAWRIHTVDESRGSFGPPMSDD